MIETLLKAKSDKDVLNTWSLWVEELDTLSVCISLPEYPRSVYPAGLQRILELDDSNLISYFESGNIFFLDNKLFNTMRTNGKKDTNFVIDYSICLDSNYSSYIRDFVKPVDGRNRVVGNVKLMIDELIRGNYQFDNWFFLIESYKGNFCNPENVKGKSQQERQAELYWDMLCIEMFKNIDDNEYVKSGRKKYNISETEAYLRTDSLFTDLYSSNIGKKVMEEFGYIHQLMVLFLIGTLQLKFGSSKSPQRKMAQLFEYMHSVLGVYNEREMYIAYKYFCNQSNIHILNTFNKAASPAALRDKIQNVAWDFAVPRILEKLIIFNGENQFFMPFFLTNDKRLRQMLRAFSVKGILTSKETMKSVVIPVVDYRSYYSKEEVPIDFDWYFSGDAKNSRNKKDQENRCNNFYSIENEFSKLIEIIKA